MPPGPKGKYDANREGENLSALAESKRVLDRLLQALAPYSPKQITGIDGRRYQVLAFEAGVDLDVGPRLHNVTGLIEALTDPFSIAADVLQSVIGSISIPDSASFITTLAGYFTDVLNGGSAPSKATITTLVGTVINDVSDLFGNIEAATTAELASRATGIPGTLEAYFSATDAPAPHNGDYIYNEGIGIVYVIFRQVEGVPSSNTIFRVPFDVNGTTWVALTTFPAPDIGALLQTIANLVFTAVGALMSLLAALIVNSIMALFEFISEILPLIEEAIAAAIEILRAALTALIDALGLRIDAIEALLANITTANLINRDGWMETVTVLNSEVIGDIKEPVTYLRDDGGAITADMLFWNNVPGVNRKKEITWMDSSTGIGQKAKVLVWDHTAPNIVDVDWRKIYWMGQNGTHWAAKVLSLNTEGYPKIEDYSPGPLYNAADVVTCDNGEITILKLDDA